MCQRKWQCKLEQRSIAEVEWAKTLDSKAGGEGGGLSGTAFAFKHALFAWYEIGHMLVGAAREAEPGLAPFIATSRLRWIAQVQKLASTTLAWQLRLKNGRPEQRMREQTDIGDSRSLTNSA